MKYCNVKTVILFIQKIIWLCKVSSFAFNLNTQRGKKMKQILKDHPSWPLSYDWICMTHPTGLSIFPESFLLKPRINYQRHKRSLYLPVSPLPSSSLSLWSVNFNPIVGIISPALRGWSTEKSGHFSLTGFLVAPLFLSIGLVLTGIHCHVTGSLLCSYTL